MSGEVGGGGMRVEFAGTRFLSLCARAQFVGQPPPCALCQNRNHCIVCLVQDAPAEMFICMNFASVCLSASQG